MKKINLEEISTFRSRRIITHGMTHSKVYKTYSNIKERCYSVNNPFYKYYRGRGIIMDKEFDTFEKFYQYLSSLEDFEHIEDKNYTIDRINNDLGYLIGNLRIVSRQLQAHNQRKRVTNNSGYRGVYFNKSKNKWEASVGNKNLAHRVYFGSFTTAKEAADARDKFIMENKLTNKLSQET